MPHRIKYHEAHELSGNDALMQEVAQHIADYSDATDILHYTVDGSILVFEGDYLAAAKIIHLVREYDKLQNNGWLPKIIQKFLSKIR